jgi:hypothetical protein
MAKTTQQEPTQDEVPEVVETKRPPRVSARSRGLYNNMLGTAARQFRDNNPGMEVRFVRAPEDKSDRSQLIQRRAQGYEVVSASQCGIETPHGEVGDQVRVGDTILMAIPKDMLAENRAEVAADIRAETRRVQDAYVESLKALTAGEHSSAPVGAINTTFEEREVRLRESN